ncbi:C-14 sterol reductase Erg24 [Blastocladiella britannica]|nr:C-14 sterol reductase Erg24 [Blastocladiella britannica]
MEDDAPARNTRAAARRRVGSTSPSGHQQESPIDSARPSRPTSLSPAADARRKLAASSINPRSTEYEFGGPAFTGLLIPLLPVIVMALNALCDADGCPSWRAVSSWEAALGSVLGAASTSWDLGAFVAYIGWVAWCAGMYKVLPGDVVLGTELRTGGRLEYKINAFNTLLFTTASIAAIINFHGLDMLLYIADHHLQLITAAVIVTYAISLYLYVSSYVGDKLLALGGNSGNPFYDFFIGRELNPRIGSFDLKYFFELRPGLIGWLLIDAAQAAQQYQTTGAVSDAMVLVLFFHVMYVTDSLVNESKVLTTMDITTDGFGYMLMQGDIMWVPFLYSLQARYLAVTAPHRSIGWPGIAATLALNAVGYWIFRSANAEKDAFRSDPAAPQVAHLKYMTTASGSKLLVSGWWGTARHINYFGDWIMSVAWSLPCGITHPIPWFYPIYFAVLLVHRFYRDEHKCRKKYGADWDEYCRQVQWRIIPYVF